MTYDDPSSTDTPASTPASKPAPTPPLAPPPEVPVVLRERLAALDKLRSLRTHERELVAKLADPDVAGDHRRARELGLARAALEPLARAVDQIDALLGELAGNAALLATPGILTGPDRELALMARDEQPQIEQRVLELYRQATGSLAQADDNKVGSIMLELRAGTGGEEATLWTRDLLDVYTKYAASKGWSVETLELATEPGVGGVRSCVLNVRGQGVWTFMSFEAGVHGVKRVPATEAQGRVHTSTSTVAVLPEPDEVQVKIDWANDVEEFATTSQGPGGQNVNKVATAVQIKHKPSGIIIRMMESKSQQQNRQMARRLLAARLYEIERQRQHASRAAARTAQIGTGERSEKVRTYRWKEGIVADERLPGEYALRDVLAGNLAPLHADLLDRQTQARIAAM